MKNIFRKHSDNNPKKKSKKVFGVSLTDVCERDQQPIPSIALETIEYLEQKGLQKEGIFRIPGNETILSQLKSLYDGETSGETTTTLENCEDVHAVAGLLKLYLRELPEPLLTYRFYDNFIQSQKNPDPIPRLSTIKKLITALPQSHKQLLIRLFKFLLEVAQYSEVNKMNFANLAIVLGPNILRPQHESTLRMIEDARHVNGIVRALLEEFDYLILGITDKPKNTDLTPTEDDSKQETPEIIIEVTEEPTSNKVGSMAARERLTAMREHSTPSIPCPATPEFDLSNPLEFAVNKLKAIAEEQSRPFDIANSDSLTPQQRIQEKNTVKWQLRNFDLAFQARYGHLPTKIDKEILRPLYDRYRKLGELISEDPSPPVDCNNDSEEITLNVDNLVLPIENDPQYIELVKEKKALQKHLNQYETNFVNKTRRKVQYLQDREPMKSEFCRYKQLKRKIAILQAAAEKHNGKENTEPVEG